MYKLYLGAILALTGCAGAAHELAVASHPSPAVMGTAETCLEKSAPILGADKAAAYCLEHRAMEVGRDTATARAAADAETGNRAVSPYLLGMGYGYRPMYYRSGLPWYRGGTPRIVREHEPRYSVRLDSTARGRPRRP